MNVALSRAKYPCYVVGNCSTLKNNNYWKKLIDFCINRDCYYNISSLSEKKIIKKNILNYSDNKNNNYKSEKKKNKNDKNHHKYHKKIIITIIIILTIIIIIIIMKKYLEIKEKEKIIIKNKLYLNYQLLLLYNKYFSIIIISFIQIDKNL